MNCIDRTATVNPRNYHHSNSNINNFFGNHNNKFNRFEFDIEFDDNVTLEQINSIIRIKKLSK